MADGVSVVIPRTSLCQLVMDLLGAYYAWDLSFPKRYQIMSFLQVHLLKDDQDQVHRGAALMKFEKLFTETL